MRYMSMLLMGVCFAGLPVVTGCDRTVSHEESTKTDSNGDTVHKDTTVTQDNNGDTTKTQTKTVNNP